MTITVQSFESNIFRSLYNYISKTRYTKNGTTQRLQDYFSGLSIGIEFPDDIEILSLPHISLAAPISETADPITYDEYCVESFFYTIYGFAGGKNSHALNEEQKYKLRNDIKEILKNRTIDMHDYTVDTSLGAISNSPRLTLTQTQQTGAIPPIKHNTVYFSNVEEVANDVDFTAPASLSAGTVEWALSTGNLNFSSADLASYSGQTIYEHLISNSMRCRDLRVENIFSGETENEKHRFMISFALEALKK